MERGLKDQFLGMEEVLIQAFQPLPEAGSGSGSGRCGSADASLLTPLCATAFRQDGLLTTCDRQKSPHLSLAPSGLIQGRTARTQQE